ncbi:hypothetical protein AB0B45_38575 [Nonomuraea sp. NPDC049152]|uniref:hypothetical protein n=1 Tax=Nonomuraea sp. NPDC049152 TaxID=3154350 RepID=UPI00340F4C10
MFAFWTRSASPIAVAAGGGALAGAVDLAALGFGQLGHDGNLTGARLGVHFALKRGSRFIRVVLLCAVIALVVKLAYDQFA